MRVLNVLTTQWSKRAEVLDNSGLTALQFNYAVKSLKTKGLVEVESTEDFLGKTWWLRLKPNNKEEL